MNELIEVEFCNGSWDVGMHVGDDLYSVGNFATEQEAVGIKVLVTKAVNALGAYEANKRQAKRDGLPNPGLLAERGEIVP